MFSLTVVDHIMIAHSFRGEAFGPAQRLHGATFIVEAELRAPRLDDLHLLVGHRASEGSAPRRPRAHRLPQPRRRAGLRRQEHHHRVSLPAHPWRAAQACQDGRLGDGGRAVTGIKVLLRESHIAWAAFEGPV
jgi:hypothetical protein